jgi:hypothetical protein
MCEFQVSGRWRRLVSRDKADLGFANLNTSKLEWQFCVRCNLHGLPLFFYYPLVLSLIGFDIQTVNASYKYPSPFYSPRSLRASPRLDGIISACISHVSRRLKAVPR